MKYDNLLGFADPQTTGHAAMGAITGVQGFPSRERAVALGVVFLLLCRHMDTHPGNVLSTAQNILNDDPKFIPELRGVQDYIKHEVNV